MRKDYYGTLGISSTANDAEIRTAYRSLALQWHPDRNKSPEAEEKFKEISEAYSVLSDKKKRKQYNVGDSSFTIYQYDKDDRDISFFMNIFDLFWGMYGHDKDARQPVSKKFEGVYQVQIKPAGNVEFYRTKGVEINGMVETISHLGRNLFMERFDGRLGLSNCLHTLASSGVGNFSGDFAGTGALATITGGISISVSEPITIIARNAKGQIDISGEEDDGMYYVPSYRSYHKKVLRPFRMDLYLESARGNISVRFRP
ncbi:hypothetical protein EPN87_03290 [archaeon]|nr:MAG: hypothetical protein EPN87_03290 [archaeon]